MLRRVLTPAVLTAGVLALTVAGAAAADASKSPTPAATASAPTPGKSLLAPAAAVAGKAPAGYKLVVSPLLASPAHSQTRGTVDCPAGKVPLGGGVFIVSGDPIVNVNSSFPTLTGWDGDVNNASGAATSFEVLVVCAKQPKKYSINEFSSTSVPAGTQNAGLASCPAGSQPLGGGAVSNSFSTAVNLNSTFPVGQSWRVDVNNGSTSDTTFDTWVICGKVKGYTVVVGDQFETAPFRQVRSTATCPAPTVPIGGGVFADSDLDVNINSTVPQGSDWVVFQNNAGPSNGTADVFAVCAGR